MADGRTRIPLRRRLLIAAAALSLAAYAVAIWVGAEIDKAWR